jgi:hypothetical protein
MPIYMVQGWFKRTTLRETWTEVEAPDEATAIQLAQDEDEEGDLEWRDDDQEPEDTDKEWSAQITGENVP